jgi:cyclase
MPAEWSAFYRGLVKQPSLVEVTDGVFAYIHHDGSWGLNNSGFVHSSDQLAVIDSALTEGRARAFRETIESTSGLQPQLLINTHHHSDHTFGNSVFADTCIVGHRRCRDAVLRQGLTPTAQDPAVPWGDIRLLPPQLLFDRELDIFVGEHAVKLVYVGPAHTDNDVIAWLPERRVLFAGDVLFNHATPITHGGSIWGSVKALELMRDLQPDAIVPGHGAVCGVEVIDDWLRYFAFVSDVAARGAEADLSPLEVAREQDLGEFSDWQHPERLVLNLHRAYAELSGPDSGASVDEAQAFADMLQLNPSAYGHRIIEEKEQYVELSPSHVAAH